MRNVVLDIGQVLVHLDYRPLMSLLASRGFVPAGLEDVTDRIGLLEHESGRLDGAGLLDNLAALGSQPISRDEAREAWLDMFDPQPRMFALAGALSVRYRVYLLSNVGDLHWAHLHARHGPAAGLARHRPRGPRRHRRAVARAGRGSGLKRCPPFRPRSGCWCCRTSS
jgi:hypothetical protein